MNTNQNLKWDVIRLPAFFNGSGPCGSCLHIGGIPVDELAGEPIVIEIQWEEA